MVVARTPEFRGGECGMNGKPQKPAAEGKIPAVGKLRVVAGGCIRRRRDRRKVGTGHRRRGADEEEGMGKMRRVVVVGGICRILPRQGGCGGGGGGGQMGTPLLLGLFDQIKPDRIRSNQRETGSSNSDADYCDNEMGNIGARQGGIYLRRSDNEMGFFGKCHRLMVGR